MSETTPGRLKSPTLIADIGGTNARFAVANADGSVGRSVHFPIAGHDDLGAALTNVVLPQLPATPSSAVIAIAGEIDGDGARLTNGHWVIEPLRLLEEFGLDEIWLLNDLEALALSLPHLGDNGLAPIGGGLNQDESPKVVIGAGTGLGVASLIPVAGRWLPIPTEGGHIDFGPADRRDYEIWPHLRGADGRISAEMILSGAGIERLYVAVSRTNGRTDESCVAADIVSRANDRSDDTAVETINRYSAYFGRFAGSLALVFLARGGVYIGGGIAPRIATQIQTGPFRRCFEDKQPFSALVGSIATSLILDSEPALLGLAKLVADPDRFLIDHSKRRWRR